MSDCNITRVLMLLALGLALGAQGASLEIGITPKFSSEVIQPASLRYRTSAGEAFSITRVSFLASDFALQRMDGTWLEMTNSAAWFDLERNRNSFRLDEIPVGEYGSIRFCIGLETNLNHADVAQFPAGHTLNPEVNGLHWSWQGGYIFLALEGLWRNAGGQFDGWAYHLARDPNCTRITLAAPLTITDRSRVDIDFDIATLLNAPRPLSFAQDGTSTHSRDGDPIAAALDSNLPGAFRIHGVNTNIETAASLARVEPLYLPKKFTPYAFNMNATFPIPDLPRDNPLTVERVALGEMLFHETALSRDGTLSCASCHKTSEGMSDARQFSVGVRGQVGVRHAMPLFNLAWKRTFFWDGRAPSLRAQSLMPIQDHSEMDESLASVATKLAADSNYRAAFQTAFEPGDITPEKISLALEQFLLTRISGDSKFDRAMRGAETLTDEEKRGFQLFSTEYDPRRGQFGADCFHCHGGMLFKSQEFGNNGLDSDVKDSANQSPVGTPRRGVRGEAISTRNLGRLGEASLPLSPKDIGRAKVTGKDSDAGKFAVPSLRNVELRAPYMHDGRFKTLEEAVAHYSTGVRRSATLDPNLAKHPDGGLHLSDSDQRALVAFLKTLTDDSRRTNADRVVASTL